MSQDTAGQSPLYPPVSHAQIRAVAHRLGEHALDAIFHYARVLELSQENEGLRQELTTARLTHHAAEMELAQARATEHELRAEIARLNPKRAALPRKRKS